VLLRFPKESGVFTIETAGRIRPNLRSDRSLANHQKGVRPENKRMIVRPKHFAFDREKQRQFEQLAKDEMLSQEQRELTSEVGADEPFFTEVQSFCFYCAEKLTVPAVVWHGCAGKQPGDITEIWLHPRCAEQLSARIQRDVNELNIGKKKADARLADWKRDHPV
jgi:hypothetical protein